MASIDTIQATSPATNGLGAIFYFHPDTLEVGKQLGLDGFRWYLLGRGGALGDVSAAVVQSAFGYFEPGLVEKLWTTAREKVAPAEAAQRYFDCCGALGAKLLADVAGLDAYVEAADVVIGAMPRAGLPLFAGTAELVCSDDVAARAMQKAAVLRELRGSAHLVAVLASGLSDAQAHALKRPDDVAMFGWTDGVEVPDDGAERMARAEEITDLILVPAYDALNDAQAAALETGTAAMAAACALN